MQLRALLCFVIALLGIQPAFAAAGDDANNANDSNGYIVLSYHDIVSEVRSDREPDSIDAEQLVEQFAWMRDQGYTPVSLSDIIAAHDGKKPLPPKAVLLTFDDGYASLYTQVFPLLKMFRYPAVAAVVGSWMETPMNQPVTYGGRQMPRGDFVTWLELREMADSGLVEVASHSYDLHYGVPANPQGNLQPAATTRRYDATTASYESDTDYLNRVRNDLRRNSALIAKRLGKAPRAMVWPYGAYSLDTARLAREAGMPIGFGLNEGRNRATQPLDQIRRAWLLYTSTLDNFAGSLQPELAPDLERIVHVDLDYVYDEDPAQQEANLGVLVSRIKALGVSTVYLQAFADPDGNGAANALYFPNRHLPMRADLFNRVAWQLRTRAGVKVFAWMPVLAFELPTTHAPVGRTVTANDDKSGYPRLSLFDPAARQVVKDIYADLAKNAPVAGILFHDDATLSDYEDASPAALAFYKNQWGLPDNLDAIRADPATMKSWTQHKTRALTDFTLELADVMRRYQPEIKTARNLYAATVMTPESETWFAQSAQDFLASYDYMAVMAMPQMENAPDPKRWMQQLFERIAQMPGGLEKTVFELQSRDWRSDQPIPSSVLYDQVRQLRLLGARHIGYYPDDFSNNQPAFDVIEPAISKNSQLDR